MICYASIFEIYSLKENEHAGVWINHHKRKKTNKLSTPQFPKNDEVNLSIDWLHQASDVNVSDHEFEYCDTVILGWQIAT